MLQRLAPLALVLGACAAPRTQEPQRLEVVVLENAAAVDVARSLGGLFAGGGEAAPRVAADVRTNSLIIHGTPEQVAEVKDLIVPLDREIR